MARYGLIAAWEDISQFVLNAGPQPVWSRDWSGRNPNQTG